jgi:cold shock CspA family protein
MRGTMLWFNEAKNHGFILSEEGERLYVHRDDFLPGEVPVGRCATKPVLFRISERDAQRVAVNVSMEEEQDSQRARRRGPGVRAGSR